MSFQLVTDGTCDLDYSLPQELGVSVIPFKVSIGDGEYRPFNGDPSLPNTFNTREFYQYMHQGQFAHTSQVNPEDYIAWFEPMLQQGQDILYLGFTSGLSGSCQNALIAAQELAERYPQRTLRVVDTLCASIGQGLLVYLTDEKRKAGLSLEETAQWVESVKKRIVHVFTVDDLSYLRHGGRLSGTAAFFGTMLSIKPVLEVDAEGKLFASAKVQGRKRALKTLVDRMEACVKEPAKATAFMANADSEEDAHWVEALVKERLGVTVRHFSSMGPVIGCHVGPGTVALTFMADEERK